MSEERIKADFQLLALQAKYTIPEGWMPFCWEIKEYGKPNEYLEIKGAICEVKFTRGPRKGKLNWQKRHHEMALALEHSEVEAAKAKWSRDTGNCGECFGNGTRWAGWNCETGNRYVPCKHCGATGRGEA